MKSCFLSALLLSLCALPANAQLQPVQSGVYRWADCPVEASEGRESRKILEGTTPHLEYLEIHATTQAVGAKPRPAHANEDIEELIVVTQGLLQFTVEGKSQMLGAGSVVSLMPQQTHALENAGDTALTYYVLRYRSREPKDLDRGTASGGTLVLDINQLPLQPSSRGAGRRYFDRPTAMCERLELHVTQLHHKGPSHDPHTHGETEVILVLSGATEMTIDGQHDTATAGDLYLVVGGLHHGVGNASDQPCSYVALKWR